jgi:hypothetical protein
MRNKTRVPTKIDKFIDYLRNADDYLQATEPGATEPNWERLTLSGAEMTEIHTRRLFMDGIVPKYNDPAEKTIVVERQFAEFRTDFREYFNPLLDKMASCGFANVKDEAELNFVITRKDPTRPEIAIKDDCITLLSPMKGGEMDASSRTEDDTKRPSVPDHATGVQYSIKIGGSPPSDPDDDSMKSVFLSGSSHILKLGAKNTGKKYYIYSRWFNPTYPEFAGPWGDMLTGGIG